MKTTNLELPCERFLAHGADSLSDCELLAIILRTGIKGENSVAIAKRILALTPENDLHGLCTVSIPELMRIKGVGEVKAVKMKCIAELSERITRKRKSRGYSFKTASDIADYYMENMRMLEQEKVILVMLDLKNRLIADTVLSVGTISSAPVSNREIMKIAIKYNAVGIVLLHNHPSGDCTPSANDILTTKRLKDAGDLMNIPLIDHIIIGDKEYTSLREMKVIS